MPAFPDDRHAWMSGPEPSGSRFTGGRGQLLPGNPGTWATCGDRRGRGKPCTVGDQGHGGAMGADRAGNGDRAPATRPRVEFALLWGFLGLRAFDLAQAGIAVASG